MLNEKLSFFTYMEIVPRTTNQQKKFSTKSKTFYKTPKMLEAEYRLVRALSGHQPKEKFIRPIKLTVYWIFQKTQKAKDGEVKAVTPDLDNLLKALQDIMKRLGFYKDDSLIVELHSKKVMHEKSGLYVEIEEVPKIDEEINKLLEKF